MPDILGVNRHNNNNNSNNNKLYWDSRTRLSLLTGQTGTNKETVFIDTEVPLAHNLQATSTERQRKISGLGVL
jgi:hypothetical protein